MAEQPRVVIEADGGSRGNPGPAGYGAVLKDPVTGAVIAEAAEAIGRASNNVAEYRGLIAGLKLYAEHAAAGASLEVRMDSKLVVEQMAGRWKVKHPNMRPLALAAQRLAPAGVTWTWVPRAQNEHADRLVNLALDAAARGEVYVVGDTSADPTTSADLDTTGRGGANRPGDPTPDALEPPAAGIAGQPAPTNPMLGWSDTLGAETTLILLRHGETDATVSRRFSGPGGDDPGLNDTGREQALRAAGALAAELRVDALLASPMRRTMETADVVASALGLQVEVVDGFRECAFGEWDGYTLQEVRERWPAEVDAWLTSHEACPPGGESMTGLQRRVEEALSRTLSTYAGKTIVVVSHVNPIKLVVRLCLDAPLHSIHRMLVAPGSVTTVSFYESGASALHQFSAVT
ncbi:MAG: bifunctional RNase H/acid phosphatase [Propionibacteriales bacterium]|nr:bifunctional RNase H/acid phosphatase [Propionibacteriales bacterium]